MKKKLIIPALLFCACRKNYELPPLREAAMGAKINIAMVRAKHVTGQSYRFKADSNVYALVTADESTGNLYREIYISDATGGLHVNLATSGGISTGDSIRINLKGVTLNEDNGLVQLDSLDPYTSMVKLASNVRTAAQRATLPAVLSGSLQSRLVEIDNVEFIPADRDQPLADATGKSAVARTLKSCDGRTVTLRTSGYANFASSPTPAGNGRIVAIASQYRTSVQLLIRNAADISMNAPLCPLPGPAGKKYLSKDFNDNSVTSGGWEMNYVTAQVGWSTSSQGGASTPYAQIKNKSGTFVPCETWLISPPVDLTSAVNPVLTFSNASAYSGDPLQLKISLTYTAGAPGSADWNTVPFNASAGSFTFTSSGEIPLSAYRSKQVRIAFRYTGSATSGATWELDDIAVMEK